MTIYFFVRSLNERTGGGSHYNAISFIRYLRKAGHRVEVHAFSDGNNAPPDDIVLTQHPGASYGFIEAQHRLALLLREYEADADLFFLYSPDFVWGGGRYRHAGGKKPVVSYLDNYLASMPYMHTDAEHAGGILSRLAAFFYRLKRALWERFVGLRYARAVDRYLAVSPFVERTYIRHGFPLERFRVVPNFFDFEEVPAQPRTAGRPLRFLYAGRLTHDKGVDLLIEAFARLDPASATLRIIGDGPYRVRLLKRCEELHLIERVSFGPWMSAEELTDAYQASDAFVHPARWPEPFGRTLVEALASGIPVVAPITGGAAGIAGDAGILFKNGDVVSLTQAMKRLVSDAALYTKLASSARTQAKRFGEETVGPVLLEALLGLD